MTRNEAIEKLRDQDIYHGAYANQIVRALEALGLLKFEEEKKVDWIARAKEVINDKYYSGTKMKKLLAGLLEIIDNSPGKGDKVVINEGYRQVVGVLLRKYREK